MESVTHARLKDLADGAVLAASRVFPGSSLDELAQRAGSITICWDYSSRVVDTLRNLHILHAATGAVISEIEKSLAAAAALDPIEELRR